jgi:drug/metabolite transporter (DMT)-like permease
MVLYVFLTVSGLILFKLGANSTQIGIIAKGILNLQISFTALIGLFCYLCSFIIYLILISKNALSFLIPVVTGIVYISVLTASIFILKEKVTLISLAGSLLILIGVTLIIFKEKI